MGSSAGPDESSYDLFLSYNSADHGVVEDVARKLRDAGLAPFLDRWYLAPGIRWRPKRGKPRHLWGPERWALGNREKWTSHSISRQEIRNSPSYRYYSLAVGKGGEIELCEDN